MKMITKTLGKTDTKIPAIGIGSWQLGVNPEQEIEAIKAGIDAGAKYIDTAEVYNTEQLVGKAISGRKDVFIATKVWSTHLQYDEVIRACDRSLKNLGVKTVDLYQIHWPNPSISISETMKAMEKLVEDGKIRYIGVSNFPKNLLVEAQNSLSKYDIVSDQVEYSLLVRDPEKELLPFCQENKVTLIAYSPLGHGELFDPKNKELLQSLERIGEKYNKTAVQVSLNWLIKKENVVTIPKASTKEHMLENTSSADFMLSAEDEAKISEIAEKFHKQTTASKFGVKI